MADLKEELKQVIRGEAEDDALALKHYSRDASLFEVKPRLVVFPKDAEDVCALIKFINSHSEEKLSLTCRAGGSGMDGGALSESVVLDFTRHMNRIKEMNDDFAVVEPGVFYRDFEKETLKRGLMLPSYPASKELCAIGGMVGNNAGGEKSLIYGKTEKYVVELKAVLADGKEYVFKPLLKNELDVKTRQEDYEGEVYRRIFKLINDNYEKLQAARPRVSKNSAGYYLWNVWDKSIFDLTQLFVGSQGTLGIITEIKLRLVKPKEHSALLVVFLKDLKHLTEMVGRVLKHNPESLESFDDHTLAIALRYFWGFVKLMGLNIVSLGLQFWPEFKMLIFGCLPKLIILVEFTGDSAEEVVSRAEAAERDLRDLGIKMSIAKQPREIAKYFTIRHESFNLLRHHIKGKRTVPFIDDFIVRPEHLPEFFPKLEAILKEYPDLIYTIAGHVGDGNFHIIPLMDLRIAENRKIIPELSKKVYKLVLEYGGSITAEHNDGLIRTPFLEDMYGKEVCGIFAETKRIFDPNNIFNPRKKVNGDLDFAMRHLAEEN
ncbi:MAG: FAD-binding oxidoreductase [Candidatus Niyogibacteria bacterium]|nr:FAD-binding oxidoreductase [Candidatus Niyogibacteria bacterium]